MSLVGLGTVIVTFIVVGYMSATIVVKLGKKARNRSATVAACLSVVSAIAGTLILYRVVVHVVLYMWGGHAAGVTADFGWIVAAVGLVIALIASWSFAVKIVNETKFCEDCDCFMGIGMVGGLSLPDTVIVVEAIKQKKMSAAVGMVSATRLCLVIRKAGPARLHFKPKKRFSGLEESLAVPSRYYQTQPSGAAGLVTLEECPSCEGAIVEVLALFRGYALTEDGQVETMDETWLVASSYIDAGEVAALKSLPKVLAL